MGVPIDQQVTESIDILVAGSDTTAFTLTVCLNAVLSNAHLKRKVVAAVDEAMLDPHKLPSFVELEKNAYLSAVVKESLRFAMAVPGMLPKVVPERSQPFMVDGKVVPPGTVVGMSAYTMNFSEELWGPDAKEFKPERWFGEQAKTLDSGLATFSKGSRQCIGIKSVTSAPFLFSQLGLLINLQCCTCRSHTRHYVPLPQLWNGACHAENETPGCVHIPSFVTWTTGSFHGQDLTPCMHIWNKWSGQQNVMRSCKNASSSASKSILLLYVAGGMLTGFGPLQVQFAKNPRKGL